MSNVSSVTPKFSGSRKPSFSSSRTSFAPSRRSTKSSVTTPKLPSSSSTTSKTSKYSGSGSKLSSAPNSKRHNTPASISDELLCRSLETGRTTEKSSPITSTKFPQTSQENMSARIPPGDVIQAPLVFEDTLPAPPIFGDGTPIPDPKLSMVGSTPHTTAGRLSYSPHSTRNSSTPSKTSQTLVSNRGNSVASKTSGSTEVGEGFEWRSNGNVATPSNVSQSAIDEQDGYNSSNGSLSKYENLSGSRRSILKTPRSTAQNEVNGMGAEIEPTERDINEPEEQVVGLDDRKTVSIDPKPEVFYVEPRLQPQSTISSEGSQETDSLAKDTVSISKSESIVIPNPSRRSESDSISSKLSSASSKSSKSKIRHSTSASLSDTHYDTKPIVQPLNQTESVLNQKDVVDLFKAFSRKIAKKFTTEDIASLYMLANIPEQLQTKLTNGVAVMNYLTNNRRMNVQFLTILLEEMERVDLLEELLAWVQEKEEIAREGQKRGQRVGIAGPSENESTYITIVQRMRERILDPGTLVRGCEELANIVGSVRAQVAECGISVILAAMRHHIMSEPVQEAGCISLANICYQHKTLHALIVMQGGIRHIQLSMRSHVNNDLVQRAACGALANLALRYDDIRKQCVADGVLKGIINAMSAHKEETEVQEQGCCALCNIATNQPEIQNKICSIGGLECVLSALTIHRYDEMVVGNALSALQTLCSYNKSVQEMTQKKDVMCHVIDAMLAFTTSSIVIEAGSGVLGNLCSRSAKNRVKAGKNGSIKMVIDAIHNHSNDETVVTRALIAITNVCFNNDLNRIIAKKLGAVEAIVTGMSQHPSSAKVQRQACRAISNICVKNVDLKPEILTHHVIDHVCKALTNHLEESRVVEPVLSALYSLCVYHGLRQEIDSTNVEEIISHIRKVYPADSTVHDKALLTEQELKSDENCFGFIGNWRRMSHALWGGGEVLGKEGRLDAGPGTTITQQAKTKVSNKVEKVKAGTEKANVIKVKEVENTEIDLERGEMTPKSVTHSSRRSNATINSSKASDETPSRGSYNSNFTANESLNYQTPKLSHADSEGSISPSQKFSPNRGLTEAEIF